MKLKIIASIIFSIGIIALAAHVPLKGQCEACIPDESAKDAEVFQSGAHLSVLEFKSRLRQSDVALIDVRTPQEFSGGHIKNAENIDFYDSDFSARVSELDKVKKYLIYCRTGHRSGDALKVMTSAGLEVADLSGGITEWQKEGGEVTVD
jgi:rhodanese-related sulfurtransferase